MVAVMGSVHHMISRLGCFFFLVLAGVMLAGLRPAMAEGKADRTAGEPAGGSPLLYIDEASLELGTVQEGAPVRHAIRIGNRGKAPLRILQFRQWKGSRLASADRELAPGADGTIVLDITTLNGGPHAVRGVTFRTNEAEDPLHRIALRLVVTPQIQIFPERVYLEGIVCQSPSKDVRITGHLVEPLVLTAVDCSTSKAAAFTHTLAPAGRPGAYLLTVRSRLGSAGTDRARLLFKTNYPLKPMLVIPVQVLLRDAVQVVPERIDFGRASKARHLLGEGGKDNGEKRAKARSGPGAALFVRLNRPGTLQIERVASALAEGFAAAFAPVEAGKSYRIDITARVGRLPEGITESELTIYTDDPGQPVLRVPLRIEVDR